MIRAFLTFLAVLICLPTPAQATSFHETWDRPVGFIRTAALTSAPQAFLAFCKRHPEDCVPDTSGQVVTLDARRMRGSRLELTIELAAAARSLQNALLGPRE